MRDCQDEKLNLETKKRERNIRLKIWKNYKNETLNIYT